MHYKLIVCIVASIFHSDSKDAQAKDCLDTLGYTEIPLIHGQYSGWYYLPVEIDKISCLFVLDTGAAQNLLSEEASARLKYNLKPERVIVSSGGRTKKVFGNASPCLRVNTFVYTGADFTISGLPFATSDQGDGIKQPVYGLLGAPFLKYFSAIIDYRTDTLYLLDPSKAAKPLQGNWAITSAKSSTRDAYVHKDYQLYIKGGVAQFGIPNAKKTYLLQFRPGGSHNRLDLLMPRNGSKPVIYKIEGDILTMAGQLFDDNLPLSPRPTSFTTTDKGSYIVLTFDRVKTPDASIPHIKD